MSQIVEKKKMKYGCGHLYVMKPSDVILVKPLPINKAMVLYFYTIVNFKEVFFINPQKTSLCVLVTTNYEFVLIVWNISATLLPDKFPNNEIPSYLWNAASYL